MGLFYLLSEICSFIGFFVEIPATICRGLAIYFYSVGQQMSTNNDEEQNEE